ncbi:MAG: HNH endonuclease, partial [Acidobacteriota bacterium]
MLNSGVLVLNRLFQAVHVTSVRRAFCLLYKGYVRVVDPDYRTYDFDNWCDLPVQPEDEFIRTPSDRI